MQKPNRTLLMFFRRTILIIFSLVFLFPGVCPAANELRNFPYASKHEEKQAKPPASQSEESAFWGRLLTSSGDQDDIDSISGYDFTGHGFVVGCDKKITKNTRAGVSGSYIKSDINSNTAGSSSDVNSYNFGLYGSYDSDLNRHPFYVDGVAIYSRGDIDISRAGGITADTHSNTFSVAMEYGYKGQYTKSFTLSPVIGFQTSFVFLNGYTEIGTGALEIDDSINKFLSSTIGLKASYEKKYLTLDASILWAHEFSSDRQSSTGSRAAGSTAQFAKTSGLDADADKAILGTSMTLGKVGPTSLTLGYDAELGHKNMCHTQGI